MVKNKIYRYLGRNGILTTPILLNDSTKIDMYRLIAEKGKMLTNGEQILKSVDIFPEDLTLWTEIADPNPYKE